MFKLATKQQSRLRLAIIGPSGSGKTYTALTLAQFLGKRIAVIDTERGSASKYSDLFKFDVGELPTHNPEDYMLAIQMAEESGYEVLIIDSLSHAWSGRDGALELVDKAAKRSQSGNSYTAWRDVTPLHNRLVDTILQSKCHVIATMRAKTDYVMEPDSKGRMVPRRVGLAPIQRDGMEYEFDVTADMTLDHDLIIGKTRCHSIDGKVFAKPGKKFAEVLLKWVSDGAPPVENPTSAGVLAVTTTQIVDAGHRSDSTAVVSASAASPTSEDAPVTNEAETWLGQVVTYAGSLKIPGGAVGTYFKELGLPVKKPKSEWLTFEVFESAIKDLDAVADVLVKDLGGGYTEVPKAALSKAFREVLDAKKADAVIDAIVNDIPDDSSPEPATAEVETPEAAEVLVGSDVAGT